MHAVKKVVVPLLVNSSLPSGATTTARQRQRDTGALPDSVFAQLDLLALSIPKPSLVHEMDTPRYGYWNHPLLGTRAGAPGGLLKRRHCQPEADPSSPVPSPPPPPSSPTSRPCSPATTAATASSAVERKRLLDTATFSESATAIPVSMAQAVREAQYRFAAACAGPATAAMSIEAQQSSATLQRARLAHAPGSESCARTASMNPFGGTAAAATVASTGILQLASQLPAPHVLPSLTSTSGVRSAMALPEAASMHLDAAAPSAQSLAQPSLTSDDSEDSVAMFGDALPLYGRSTSPNAMQTQDGIRGTGSSGRALPQRDFYAFSTGDCEKKCRIRRNSR